MAYATLTLEHPVLRQIREAPVGYSWTTLIFGFFPALFRSHYGGAVILFLIGLLTFGLSNIVFSFIYNKMYLKYLVGQGFQARGDKAYVDMIAARSGVYLPSLAPPSV